MNKAFGDFLRLSVAGASHASALAFELANFPAGFRIDETELAAFMARRAPGCSPLATARKEPDAVVFTSGLADGVTTGGVLCGRIANVDRRPNDYGAERTVPRPGHADFPQWVRMGRIPTGGGSNSGRLTAALCAAGGACLQWLERRGIRVSAKIDTIGGKADDFAETIRAAQADGDSVGGTIVCEATGLPPGVGGALFDGVETELAGALFAIPGVKGVEFGNGFEVAKMRGSENNDPFRLDAEGAVVTDGNNHGGILGGMTSGMPLRLRVALKPTPTVFRPQPSVDLARGVETPCEIKGRHDPCIVVRAVPVVEAVTAFVLTDLLLADEAARPRVCLTLTGATLEEDLAQFRAQRLFADMVELRADLLSERDVDAVRAFPARVGVPVILTFRRQADGGAFAGDEETRADFFRRALAPGCGFAYVDFEDDFRRDDLAALARAAGVRVVRSVHRFDGPVAGVPSVCRALRGDSDEIPKIAFTPRSLADISALFAETADFTDVPHVVCAMGARGFASRALAARTRSLWTYASAAGLDGIGHVTPRDLVRDFRVRGVTRDAALYGVTGWPLKTTRSPEINNAAFVAEAADAVMVPMPAETAEEALAFMKATGMRGMAVTIPHKQAIMPLLDEIAPEAQAVGAVNTVVLEHGRYVGHNTDAAGFSEALLRFLGRDTLVGERVAVLGAGGASKAVVYALEKLGAAVETFHRRPLTPGFRVVVNATPVDPIPEYAFAGDEAVYDLVYAPPETPLMARARAAGCRVENGFSMLEAQAREQRRLYAASAKKKRAPLVLKRGKITTVQSA